MASTPWSSFALLGVTILSVACSDGTTPTSPRPSAAASGQQTPSEFDPAVELAVRQLAAPRGVIPLAHPAHVRPQLVLLGQARSGSGRSTSPTRARTRSMPSTTPCPRRIPG